MKRIGPQGDVFGVEFFDPLGGGLGIEDSLEGFDHVDGELVGFGGVVVVVGVGDARVFEVEVVEESCSCGPVEGSEAESAVFGAVRAVVAAVYGWSDDALVVSLELLVVFAFGDELGVSLLVPGHGRGWCVEHVDEPHALHCEGVHHEAGLNLLAFAAVAASDDSGEDAGGGAVGRGEVDV